MSQTFDCADLFIKHITVYLDRAEVRKVINVDLVNGVNEILIKKLPPSIDPDSIRVEGSGEATIIEVLCNELLVKNDDVLSNKEKELQHQLTKLRDDEIEFSLEKNRLKEKRAFWDAISAPGLSSERKWVDMLTMVAELGFPKLEEVLSFSDDKKKTMDYELKLVQKQLDNVTKEITVIGQNLRQIRDENSTVVIKHASLKLNATEGMSVVLEFSYIVKNASWKPSYDVRVETTGSLQVSYYGVIKQNTKEDWNDVALSLSTAMPMIGGNISELKSMQIGFVSSMKQSVIKSAAEAGTTHAHSAKNLDHSSTSPKDNEKPRIQTVVKEIKESLSTVSFDIVQSTTIPSNEFTHKVTIAMIDLEPTFEYETVPSISPYVYLKVKAKNTSNYQFLAGTLSVFVDKNFVAKTSIKNVAPSEYFHCSLGVEPGISVDYKPRKLFHEQQGILSTSSTITLEKRIVCTNKKKTPVKVTITEPYPTSKDEKLKITLVEPDLKRIETGVSFKFNEQKNVEWIVEIPVDQSKELLLKYSLSFPKSESLDCEID